MHNNYIHPFFKQMPVALLLISLCVLFMANPSFSAINSAEIEKVYTIDGIKIDESDQSVNAAKEKGLRSAEKEAFSRLLDIIVPERFREDVPDFLAEDISKSVKGFQIQKENVGTKRYRATVAITFNRQNIRALLDLNNINYVEKKSPAVLILPLMQDGEQVYLWEPQNIWRNVWKKYAGKSWVIPTIIPFGDLEDMRLVNTGNVLFEEYSALKKLSEKYNAEDIIIMEAVYNILPGSNLPRLDVTIKFIDDSGSKIEKNFLFETREIMDKEELFTLSFKKILTFLEDRWREEFNWNADDIDDVIVEEFTLAIDGIEHWLQMKEAISNMEAVQKMEVLQLSPAYAKILLHLTDDDPDALAQKFFNAGLQVTKQSSGQLGLRFR